MNGLDALASPRGRDDDPSDQDTDPKMGDRITPGSARQMAQPPPGCAQRLLSYPASIGEISQHAEHCPDRKCDARQRRRWRAAVEGENDCWGEKCPDGCG